MAKWEKQRGLVESAMAKYESAGFIEDDPIQIPRRFTHLPDVEIAGFIAATLAWGQRKSIITSAERWLAIMDNSPHDFVLNHTESDLKRFKGFVHRTFQEADAQYFMLALQRIYQEQNSLELFWAGRSVKEGIQAFRDAFFNSAESLPRTQKHVANPAKNSACKRINMFLKWMVRSDEFGIDLGIWKQLPPSDLMIPLDVHVHRTALNLGIVDRKQADWKTVEHLTEVLRDWDSNDPIKYDYGLFVLSHNKGL